MGFLDFLKRGKEKKEEKERDLEAEVRSVYEFCRQDGRPFTYREVMRVLELDDEDLAKKLVQGVITKGIDRGLYYDQAGAAPKPKLNKEKEFLRVYRLLKKRGVKPTYEAIAGELRIKPEEAKAIAAKIKAKQKPPGP